MDMYVFDDKAGNINSANVAIATAGHTPATTPEYWPAGSGMRHAYLRSAEKVIAGGEKN